MRSQVEQVRKFLHGWLVEGGTTPGVLHSALAPERVTSLYGLTFEAVDGGCRAQPVAWHRLELLERAVEDWAIELDVNTQPVDDAHPDAPWGDNLVRKLMVIRGSGVR